MTSHDPAEAYIRLAHAIDAHVDGYVDGYGGPPEWADRTRREPAELRAQAAALRELVQDVDDDARRTFLDVQTRAMEVSTRLLCGETLPYAEEVRGLYAIEPVRTPAAELDAALAELESAVPGTGSVLDRLEALRVHTRLRHEQILDLAAPILDELRTRTRAKFGLPDGEDFSIALVSDKPWGGYNWPLGNLKSRIDINTDQPTFLTDLPGLLAHEGYPGHHTEHATKEAELVRVRGWHEHAIQLINAPECVVSEGVAVNALSAVMDKQEFEAWLTGDLAERAGLDPEALRAHLHAERARAGLSGVAGTAALMLYEDGAPESEVLDFIQHYGPSTPARAQQTLRFIRQPSFRAYIFTYAVGDALVRGWMEREGTGAFGRLLREPLTPEQLG